MKIVILLMHFYQCLTAFRARAIAVVCVPEAEEEPWYASVSGRLHRTNNIAIRNQPES